MMRLLLVATLGLLAAAPAAAQGEDRWQITLEDGRIIWELHLVRLQGDTLVLRDADSTYRFPITAIDELRLVRKSERWQTAEPNRYGGVLGGADDEVHRLTLYEPGERSRILEDIFKRHPPLTAP